MKRQHASGSILAYGLTLLVGSVSTAHSAPGELAQQPLFLANKVAPNVLFVNDDSDSMLLELLTSDDGTLVEGRLREESDNLTPVLIHNTTCPLDSGLNDEEKIATHYRSRRYGYILQTADTKCEETVAEEEWRARTHAYNRLYFDPQRQYEPWPGYKDASITQAPIDPTTFNWDSPASGTYVNLTSDSALLINGNRDYYATEQWTDWCTSNQLSADTCEGWRYYTWIDSDGQGDIDEGELAIHWIKDQDAATQQNFANWFTYHRKREYVAKYATSKIINDTDGVRMGFATINGHNSSKWIEIQAANADKSPLINAVQNVVSDNSTPLVTALENAGEYYRDRDFFGTANATDPILPQAEGGACQLNNTILMTDGYYRDGSATRTLASIAETFYNADFRDGLPGDQRMNTYTVAFGVEGTLAPDTDVHAEGFTWPDPTTSGAAKIDDLWHAAVVGHGLFLSANNSAELVEALRSALGDITGQVQSANSVATTSFRLDDDSPVFVSRFSSDSWTGELLALQFNDDDSLRQLWNAATMLDGRNTDFRTILTFDGNSGSGVKFRWAEIGTTLQDALTASSAIEDIGASRLEYLRGKRSETFDNVTFRTRESVLGDIVNSSPVYVGSPASLYPDADPFGTDQERYFAFWNSHKTRTPVIYVGANDGMLHGFNANTGQEVLAYVPETVFPNLHELTDPDYSHRFFVDQTPSVGDVYLDNDWRTVLVGGLGAGGRGLYALDITNPDNFVESNADQLVLWEFNDDDNNNLGYTLARPVIALVKDGQESRWAAIVGNGYESETGVAALFIIYLDADLTNDGWTAGTDYEIISTQSGTPDDKNGLSSPAAVDSNGDGYIDRIYAGDLKGQLWAFDLNDSGAWQVAYGSADAPAPLFSATHGDDPQPITAKPTIIRNPVQPTLARTAPNLLVLFGTGQYLTTDDLGDTRTQSFYGVWDSGHIGAGGVPLQRDDLVEQQIILTGTDSDPELNITARITSNQTVDYTDRFGWRLDLSPAADPASIGERVISNPVVINNTVFFTTYIPNSEPCEPGGSSWFMFLNAADGGLPDRPIINITNDTLVNQNDLIELEGNGPSTFSGMRTEGTLGGLVMGLGGGQGNLGIGVLHTEGGPQKLEIDLGVGALGKRLSWRELRED